MRLFRILFVVDALGLLGLAWFFFGGLRYASSGAEYLSNWVPLLLVPAAIVAGAWPLRMRGQTGLANALLGLLAAPFVLYGLFVLLIAVAQPDFR